MVLNTREQLGQEYTDAPGAYTPVADVVHHWAGVSPLDKSRTDRKMGHLLSEHTIEANLQGEGETTIMRWLFDHPAALMLVMTAAGFCAAGVHELLSHIQA